MNLPTYCSDFTQRDTTKKRNVEDMDIGPPQLNIEFNEAKKVKTV